MDKSLQDQFAPNTHCFGCGPKNQKGLRIKSFAKGDICEAHWRPETHHEAFPGMLNGGIIGSLLDCHSNWTAAWSIMRQQGLEQPPCTVTASYNVKLLKPTSSDALIYLKAKPKELLSPNKVIIEAQLYAGEDLTATCEGLFVAVKEGHPAYHRWN